MSTDRAIKNDMDYLTEMQERLNIQQKTFIKACELAKKVELAGVVRGSRMATKCATLMIVACKLTEANKEKEVGVEKLCRVSKKEMNKFFKKIQHLVFSALAVASMSNKPRRPLAYPLKTFRRPRSSPVRSQRRSPVSPSGLSLDVWPS